MGKKSFLSLVILLVTIMMSTRGCKAKKLSSMTSGCSGYECLILDVDLEFLLDSDISMRKLASPNASNQMQYTSRALSLSAVECDRPPAYRPCIPDKNGNLKYRNCQPNDRCR
ncbi:Rapid ALkalinization Factor [Dillenia turbinata]|uniref:Rapid ALkalinization Factor n=1 Tax=Dillenia turbinata TaxID=194707 RepID=A0AAN8UAH7_9MAGN